MHLSHVKIAQIISENNRNYSFFLINKKLPVLIYFLARLNFGVR
ncbi:hypothetical protein OKW43_005229 [Paraburkholderia sp. WC7.3g]